MSMTLYASFEVHGAVHLTLGPTPPKSLHPPCTPTHLPYASSGVNLYLRPYAPAEEEWRAAWAGVAGRRVFLIKGCLEALFGPVDTVRVQTKSQGGAGAGA